MDLNQTYRSFVLAVAQNKNIQNLVMTRGKSFSRRFIAGDTLEEALKAVEVLEHDKVHSILDLLGEMVSKEEQARKFQSEIIELVRAFGAKPYPRYVALKPTQLGLDISEDMTALLLSGILEEAKKVDCFVRIDMED